MYILIFVIIVAISYCQINVLIDDLKGEYNIYIKNRVWLRSSYTGVYSQNQWFKSNDQSLRLIDTHKANENDFNLGEWNQMKLI
jgi:hypothetical protein